MHLTCNNGVIHLQGTVTAEDSDRLLETCRAALAEDEFGLALDLTEVERIDGCILQILLACRQSIPPERFRITSIPEPLTESLTLAGARELLTTPPAIG
jgi:anti-anti-sigma regulatory factor